MLILPWCVAKAWLTLPVYAQSLQSCLTLCDPMDCSPPGFSVRGIPQARILEWVAIPSSRGYYRPRDRTQVSCISCMQVDSLPLSHWGSPWLILTIHKIDILVIRCIILLNEPDIFQSIFWSNQAVCPSILQHRVFLKVIWNQTVFSVISFFPNFLFRKFSNLE